MFVWEPVAQIGHTRASGSHSNSGTELQLFTMTYVLINKYKQSKIKVLQLHGIWHLGMESTRLSQVW